MRVGIAQAAKFFHRKNLPCENCTANWDDSRPSLQVLWKTLRRPPTLLDIVNNQRMRVCSGPTRSYVTPRQRIRRVTSEQTKLTR